MWILRRRVGARLPIGGFLIGRLGDIRGFSDSSELENPGVYGDVDYYHTGIRESKTEARTVAELLLRAPRPGRIHSSNILSGVKHVQN